MLCCAKSAKIQNIKINTKQVFSSFFHVILVGFSSSLGIPQSSHCMFMLSMLSMLSFELEPELRLDTFPLEPEPLVVDERIFIYLCQLVHHGYLSSLDELEELEEMLLLSQLRRYLSDSVLLLVRERPLLPLLNMKEKVVSTHYSVIKQKSQVLKFKRTHLKTNLKVPADIAMLFS